MRSGIKSRILKNIILELFYSAGFKVKEIAEKLKVSEAYVSRIIKQDTRYENEKLRRKTNSRDKHEKDKKILSRNKRAERINEDCVIFSNLMELQAQNARAMSIKAKIRSDDIIKMNLQHYKYNPKKKRLEYDETAGLLPSGIAKMKYDYRSLSFPENKL